MLDGIPIEYDSLISLISSCVANFMIYEVETLLLEHESCIDRSKKRSLVSINLTEGNFRANDSSQPLNSKLLGQVYLTSQNAIDYKAGRGGHGFGRHKCGGRSFGCGSGGRGWFADVQCQLCHKWGHEVFFC